jgi:hypothetical protein
MRCCFTSRRGGGGGGGTGGAAAAAGPPDPDLQLYAAALQRRLDVRVELVAFVEGAGLSNPTLPCPCGLKGLAPYAAGGTDRLLLNRSSPIVLAAAKLWASSSAEGDQVRLYPIVTLQYSSTNLYQVSYYIQ